MVSATERIRAPQNMDVIRSLIHSSESIAISGHTNPDGDSIGALLSLGLGLETLGKKVYMLCEGEVPRNYRRLPGASRVIHTLLQPVDLAIAVDCGSKEMIGPAYRLFERSNHILEIDHHESRTPFGDSSFVDAKTSSAGELVYKLLVALEVPITRDIAQNILTSIIVETNSFRLPGLNSQTFEVCAELLRTGVDFHKLSETVYWVTSRESALLGGICMNRCTFSEDGEVAWSTLTQRDMVRIGASESDADPVVERIRSIRGVKIAILFREKNSTQWRVSFRAKEGINIAYLAEMFGGGGHSSAAGCSIPKRKEMREKLLLEARMMVEKHRTPDLLNEFRNLTVNITNALQTDQSSSLQEEITESALPVIAFCETVPAKKKDSRAWQESPIVPFVSLR